MALKKRGTASAPRAQPIVILGVGGNCVDILDAIQDINALASRPRYECVGFLDDDPSRHGTSIHGIPVLGGLARARALRRAVFVNGIGSVGNFRRKREIIARTGLPVERFATIVHPSAQVSRLAAIGAGTVVLQNSVIGSDARVGRHVMILPLTVISHHAVVGDYSTIAGGVSISGYVRIGRACYIGTHSAIREHLAIGDAALIGMGSIVVRDVPPGAAVAGNPARPLRGKAER
jgi:sugar O-acyltransferase (sialic acid O-acetyltransferase NeuD family)